MGSTEQTLGPESNAAHPTSGVGVLDKSMALLDTLTAGPQSLGELVTLTGFSRATTHRLAVALEQHDVIRRDREGRFCLGVRLIALGRRAADGLPLASTAMPALEALRDATQESAQLYVVQGQAAIQGRAAKGRVCIASLESPHGLRTIVPLGAVLDIDRGSAGHVLTGRHRSNPDADTPGWVASVGEREAGVASVSAPVIDGRGTVVAAVSISGPIDRLGTDPGTRHGAAVIAAARRIEHDAALS